MTMEPKKARTHPTERAAKRLYALIEESADRVINPNAPLTWEVWPPLEEALNEPPPRRPELRINFRGQAFGRVPLMDPTTARDLAPELRRRFLDEDIRAGLTQVLQRIYLRPRTT